MSAQVWAEPTSYTVCAVPETVQDWDMFAITVAQTAPDLWAIRRRSRCLAADGTWAYEPIPSERDDDFLARYRFDLDTALRLAKEAPPLVKVNGWTAERAAAEWPEESA